MNSDIEYDVAIVGFGPVGQLLAALLGMQGLRVVVFERRAGLYPLPRACVVDHEIMRMLQAIGIAEAFAAVAVHIDSDYRWMNAEGQVLLSLSHPTLGVSGWGSRYMMYQPDLESLLVNKVQTLPSVTVHRCASVTRLKSFPDHVEVHAEREAGEEGGSRTVLTARARFQVGADGANSMVRSAASLEWVDLGFRADWMVIDFRPHDTDAPLDVPLTGQICDPARPVSLFRRLGRHHVRWEMMLLPGETAEQIAEIGNVWKLLARWVSPQDGDIVRRAVYTFKSGVAHSWRRDRIMIAGDAAHLMPPFLGQGMCSGMRDAMALAWRLTAILRGELSDHVLASYTAERRHHVQELIAQSVALGKIICITDPDAATARDAEFLGGRRLPLPEALTLGHGLLQRTAGTLTPPVGQLGPQGRVQVAGQIGRFDDLVGRGWMLIASEPDVGRRLTALQPALDRIGLRTVILSDEAGATFQDVDNTYRDFCASQQVSALIMRPDFYIFGVARTPDEIPVLVEDLLTQLQGEGTLFV